MTDPDFIEQQRTIVQAFRQITAVRGRAEAEEQARFDAEQAAADAELAAARADAEAGRAATTAAATSRRTAEGRAANATLEMAQKSADASMAAVSSAARKTHGELERISATAMLSEARAQAPPAVAGGDARAELARSAEAATAAADGIPGLVDALVQARARSRRTQRLLSVSLIVLAVVAVALFLSWRTREEARVAAVAANATATAQLVAANATVTAEAVSAPATATAMAPLLADLQARSGMEMLYAPPDHFLMGSADGQGGSDEHPQHTVYLSAYWIDQTEVTAEQYQRCVEAGDCTEPITGGRCTYGDAARADHPVNCVDWQQATDYCAWADKRLPSEAEWERAARGDDGRTFPWGNQEPDETLANFSRNVGATTPVGSFPAGASPLGALDMAGNVLEWVADWYDEGYYGQSPAANPQGPASGQYRVWRGGSWSNASDVVRAAVRDRGTADFRYGNLGFRCARSP